MNIEHRIKTKLKELMGRSLGKEKIEELQNLAYQIKGLTSLVDKLCILIGSDLSQIENTKTYKEILEHTTQLKDTLENLTTADLPSLLKGGVQKKEEHLINAILGLEEDVTNFLLGQDEDIRSHQTYKYWILRYFESKVESLKEVTDVKEELIELGFTSNKAKYLAAQISRNPYNDHQTTVYWANKYVEQQFENNILLSSSISIPRNSKQPFEEPYTLPALPDEDEEGKDPVEIPCLDLNIPENAKIHENPFLNEYLHQEGHNLDGSSYWFHGTDHKSARNIIRNGIDLQRGKDCGDFSDGNGFYLTSSYTFAHHWPQSMMKKSNTAVLVFKIKNDAFTESKGLTFDTADENWEKCVGFFRNGKDSAWAKGRKARELKGASFICGPISKDGSKIKYAHWRPSPRSPLMFQLCLKNEFLAEEFFNSGENIYKAIFFY